MQYRPLHGSLTLVAVVMAIGLATLGVQSAAAQGVQPADSEIRPVRHVSITLFKSRTLQIDRPFATALIGAPEIADILPMSDRSSRISHTRWLEKATPGQGPVPRAQPEAMKDVV